jgi:hypothetical protein
MDPLNDTARDRDMTREDTDEPLGRVHDGPRWPGVIAGLLAVAGGAAVDLGLYRPYLSGEPAAFKDLVVWPDWRVRLGLSVAVGLFGLVAALLAGGPAGRTGLGGLVVPATLVATINGAISVPVLDAGISDGKLSQIAFGGWLTLGGSAAVLVAALVALAHLGPRGTLRTPGAGFLGVLGIGGLLYAWVVGSFGHRGRDPVTSYSYFSVLAGDDRHGWTAAAVIAGLALAVGAIGLAAGRVGAVAAGVALGAAAAVGVDAVIRYLMSDTLAKRDILFTNGGGLDRGNASLIAMAATVLVLLLLAAVLRGRRDSDVDEDSFVPVAEPYDSTSFGPGGGYDSSDRPFDQYTSGYGSRDPFQYLPERESGNTGRYPMMPDERAAEHPAPPGRSALRPPLD